MCERSKLAGVGGFWRNLSFAKRYAFKVFTRTVKGCNIKNMLARDFYTKHLDIDSKSDEQLLAISVHYPPAFEKLLLKYKEPFLRKARLILGNTELAEDVVQEVFTKIYLYAKKFEKREGAKFSSWAYKILLNTAFTRYQKEKKKKYIELTPELINQLSEYSKDNMFEIEIYDSVISTLLKLPKYARSVLTSYFLEGKSQKEIAQEEGVAVTTIKARIHRAKRVFKNIILKSI